MTRSCMQFFVLNSSSTSHLLRNNLCLIILALLTLSAPLNAHAVSPPPDGGYANGNTAEGKDALFNLTAGNSNTAIGFEALYNNTTGHHNTATGRVALHSLTTGIENVAIGDGALDLLKTGKQNTAVGSQALTYHQTGDQNTAIGAYALSDNTAGEGNTATGIAALEFNQGSFNTATGHFALHGNGSGEILNNGSYNTANGVDALYNLTTGTDNTASGANALYSDTTGSYNTANGSAALAGNKTGIWNTASGWGALNKNTVGSYNAAHGLQALLNNNNGNYNTACGLNSLFSNTSGSNNTGLGSGAGGALTTGSDNIDIGNSGVAGDSAKIRIGTKGTHKNTYVAGIYGITAARGIAVFIDSNGHLGTSTSSARFKDQIKPMDKASEAILSLKPVTFRYKEELDADRIPQFGLIAEEVEKINPNLVVRDEDAKVMTVRYEAVNAMLLNEFLKAHRKLEEQQAIIQRQQTQIDALVVTVQKVSEQVEVKVSGAQIAANGD